MSELYYYSLCQSIETKNKEDTFRKLLRLADIKNVDGKIGKYYDVDIKKLTSDVNDDDDDCKLDVISVYKDDFKPNELYVWKWFIDDDDKKKSFSEKVESLFYELLKIEGYYSSDNSPNFDFCGIFEKLIEGIIIPDYCRLPILFVIRDTGVEYSCIGINKENSVFENGKLRIQNKKLVNIYNINVRECIFSQKHINSYYYRNQLSHPFIDKIIYIRNTLPAPIIQMEITNFSSYLSEYVDYAIKKISLPENEAAVINKFISSGTFTSTGFEEYLKGVMPKENQTEILHSYILKYTNTELTIKNYLRSNTTEKKFFSQLIENIPYLTEKYKGILFRDYFDISRKEISKLIEPIKAEKINIENQLTDIKIRLRENTDKNTKLEQNCNDLEKEKEKLESSINILKTDFSDKSKDVVTTFKIIRDVLQISQSDDSTVSASNINNQKISKRYLNSDKSYNSKAVSNIDDSINLISDNLYINGFEDKYLSTLVFGSYIHNIPIICYGDSSDDMINAICTSFGSPNPEILCIPSGFNDYEKLISEISKSKSSYVILENILGSSDEYCYLHLDKDVPDKHIIFLVDFEDMMKLIPKEIYSHSILINSDKYYEDIKDDKPLTIGEFIIGIENNKNGQEILYNDIEKSIRNESGLKRGYSIVRSKILSIVKTENDDPFAAICPELESILSIIGCSEDYIDKLIESKHHSLNNIGKNLKQD